MLNNYIRSIKKRKPFKIDKYGSSLTMNLNFGTTLPQREFNNDISAIREFALGAEALGLSYLRVPDQVIMPIRGGFHEPLMLLSYLSAVTSRLELVPSVLVAPSRQTVLLAKQVAGLHLLSEGRIRLGLGLGGNVREYQAMGRQMVRRGQRLEEQIQLLRGLWAGHSVRLFEATEIFDEVSISPLPKSERIPIWLGPSLAPPVRALERVGELADGWFAMCDYRSFEKLHEIVRGAAVAYGRSPKEIGAECEISLVKFSTDKLLAELNCWSELGVSHVSLSTLGFRGSIKDHLDLLAKVVPLLNDTIKSQSV